MRKLPKLNLERLEERHKDLLSVFSIFEGRKLDRGAAFDLARNVEASLEEYDIKYIHQTFLLYLGMVLTKSFCDLLARQFISRGAELNSGPLSVFIKPSRPEWLAVEIRKTTPVAWKHDKAGTDLSLYCYTGQPAGNTISKHVPNSWLSWLAYKIAFSRRMLYDYEPRTLIGMIFWAHMVISEEIDFDECTVSAEMIKRNKMIAGRRTRFDRDSDKDYDDEGDPGPKCCPFELDCFCEDCRKTSLDCLASFHIDL